MSQAYSPRRLTRFPDILTSQTYSPPRYAHLPDILTSQSNLTSQNVFQLSSPYICVLFDFALFQPILVYIVYSIVCGSGYSEQQ